MLETSICIGGNEVLEGGEGAFAVNGDTFMEDRATIVVDASITATTTLTYCRSMVIFGFATTYHTSINQIVITTPSPTSSNITSITYRKWI